MRVEDWNVLKLIVFRENMGMSLSPSKAEKIFGESALKRLDPKIFSLLKDQKNPVVDSKKEYLLSNISKFLIFDWIRFISITGSVAARSAKEEDDIDLFIVVKNGTGWIYRALILVRNLFSGKVRSADGKNVKDKFCVNMIIEERGLEFQSDLFSFHELFYMIPVFNKDFWHTIINENEWVAGMGAVLPAALATKAKLKSSWLIKSVNSLAMYLQILYMIVLFHGPNIKKILSEYEDGKIMFYPKNFKGEKLDDFERRYEKRLSELIG